jgi:hypothetical protein
LHDPSPIQQGPAVEVATTDVHDDLGAIAGDRGVEDFVFGPVCEARLDDGGEVGDERAQARGRGPMNGAVLCIEQNVLGGGRHEAWEAHRRVERKDRARQHTRCADDTATGVEADHETADARVPGAVLTVGVALGLVEDVEGVARCVEDRGWVGGDA